MVKPSQGYLYRDNLVKNYIDASSISLALCVLMLTATILLTTKNSHSKTYNRLTLRPYYSVMVYLTLSILQYAMIEIWILVPPFEIIEREISSIKAFLTYYTVSVQLLEWTCLCMMVNFQARTENQDRILITREQYQKKEKQTQRIFQAIHVLMAVVLILCYPVVYYVEGNDDYAQIVFR